MKKIKFFFLTFILCASFNAKAEDQVTSLTVYGNSEQSWNMPFYIAPNNNIPGYGIISFARQLDLNQGTNAVTVSNVPEEIDPSSVMVKGLGKNNKIIEQSFASSNLSAEQLIKSHVGKQITVEKYTDGGVVTTKGKLLDSSNGLIIKEGDNVKIINDYSSVSIPDENYSGSAIKWLISSPASGDSLFEYSYKTSGISWVANYNLYVDGAGPDVMARIEGWANLINNTNIDIHETNLKLVAGETAQQEDQRARPMMAMAKGAAVAEDAAVSSASAPVMQEQKFADYHMYTVERKVDLPSQSSKKIKLFSDKEGVLATKKYVYDYTQGNAVKSLITFKNDEKSHLGIPLPGGKYRVFAKDSSGAYEQIGEVVQEHRGENEKVELAVGNSFDLKATRNQVEAEQDQLRRKGKYTVTVEIENALEKDVDIVVKEPVYQQNWQILSENFEHKKININLVEFTVTAKAKAKTKLEYVLEYSW